MTRINHRGVTRLDLITVIACAIVLAAMSLAVFGRPGGDDPPRPKTHARSIRDATQLSQIFKAFLVFSRQFDGTFPRPGRINTVGIEPGVGMEDFERNTTAALYSCMISQNFFTPELVISPVERNPHVEVKEAYDYEAYDPANDLYWDETFTADLDESSNASYAHMPMYSKRGRVEWRDTLDSDFVLLGNRGPRDGLLDPDSYTCGPHGHWAGNIVFADGHVEMRTSTWLDANVGGNAQPRDRDNIFAFDTDDGINGHDVIITFTSKIGDDLTVQFD